MRQHCTRCECVFPGAWLDVCATMFRADRGLRPGLDCHRQPRQWPLRPLLPGAITGHLWQPCHGNEGANWQTRHYTTAWWFMIDKSIHKTLQYMYTIEIEKSPCKTAAYVLLSFSVTITLPAVTGHGWRLPSLLGKDSDLHSAMHCYIETFSHIFMIEKS